MGNYVFTTSALVDAVTATPRTPTASTTWAAASSPCWSDAARRPCTTSGTTTSRGSDDSDRGYWRDVGTLDSFYDAHMDLISVDPEFSLDNREWPIFTDHADLPTGPYRARLARPRRHRDGVPARPGSTVSGSTVSRSVLSPGAHVHSWAQVDSSVLMHGVQIGRNAIVRNAILDKNVVVHEGAKSGSTWTGTGSGTRSPTTGSW